MNLIELINQELKRGFTKSELERIWDLPKNSLSAILNPDNKAKFSKKAEIRVTAYFEKDPINRPEPSPKIERGRKIGNGSPEKEKTEDVPHDNRKPKNTPTNEPKEGSGAFYLKYGAMTYSEIKK